jgi:hypothetical protein
LKLHALEKLRKANAEIVRLREMNDLQFTLLTARQLRTEFERNALSQQLQRAHIEQSELRGTVLELTDALTTSPLTRLALDH